MTKTSEYTYSNTAPGENLARMERRAFIARGFDVSLIALDPTRNVFTYDVYAH
jgi:hypothetical protein